MNIVPISSTASCTNGSTALPVSSIGIGSTNNTSQSVNSTYLTNNAPAAAVAAVANTGFSSQEG